LRELSLHVLDLIENAVRAGATSVAVTLEEQPECDLLRLVVEDNGPGLEVTPEQATDPFFTTKEGKRTGLGLSLFRFRVEQCGGELTMGRSPLGGLAVRASLGLRNVDRSPLGDLASTLYGVVAGNPELELRLQLRAGGQERVLATGDLLRELSGADGLAAGAGGPGLSMAPGKVSRLALARELCLRIKEGLEALRIEE
jgi:hypothetical protein